jgi:LysM repeat protein
MCGASLVEVEEIEQESKKKERPSFQPSRWIFWVVVLAVAAGVIWVAQELLLPLVLPEATPTPSVTPTVTATAADTASPSAIPAPTATPTPLPPRAHQVQEGETLSDIAEMYETTVDEILTLNPGITPELLQVNQVLLIPPAIPTPAPTSTPLPEGPTPTPADYLIHVVEPGDTLLSIAQTYSVTLSILWQANPDIPVGSDAIRVNQTIIIPLSTPEPTAAPTFNPNATPTPVAIYRAPPLISPVDSAVFGGRDAVIVLQWGSVGLLRSDEWYELRLGPPGGEPVVVRTWATAYRVPAELFPRTDTPTREFRWRVQVVRRIPGTEEYEVASEPGAVQVFEWLAELPPESTPTPSPTPD